MNEPTMAITTVTVRVPVTPPARNGQSARAAKDPGDVCLEIGHDHIRVWDSVTYTDCGTHYFFAPKPNDLVARLPGRANLTEIPHFPAVFKFMSEQYARNRSNPLGAFLKNAIEAMEVALADADAEGSCVYFALNAGRVKIGWSKQVATRLAQLQTGNPEPITLLAVLPGGRLREKQLHEKFAHARLSGEWFHAAPELMAYIRESARS